MTPQQKQQRLDAEIARYNHEPCLTIEERAKFIALERERLGLPDTKVTDVSQADKVIGKGQAALAAKADAR